MMHSRSGTIAGATAHRSRLSMHANRPDTVLYIQYRYRYIPVPYPWMCILLFRTVICICTLLCDVGRHVELWQQQQPFAPTLLEFHCLPAGSWCHNCRRSRDKVRQGNVRKCRLPCRIELLKRHLRYTKSSKLLIRVCAPLPRAPI